MFKRRRVIDMASIDENKKNLKLTRLFGAPRKMVWKAWTDPKMIARWWGPRGFTNPRCEWVAKKGGTIRVDMTGPDGTVYPMGGTFQEISEPERLVFVTTALDGAGKVALENRNTVTFEEFNGMTKVTLNVSVQKISPEMAMALEGMEQGWSESLYRLADLLDNKAS